MQAAEPVVPLYKRLAEQLWDGIVQAGLGEGTRRGLPDAGSRARHDGGCHARPQAFGLVSAAGSLSPHRDWGSVLRLAVLPAWAPFSARLPWWVYRLAPEVWLRLARAGMNRYRKLISSR